MMPFATLLLTESLLLGASASGLVRVADVNPERDGTCPGTLQLQDANGINVCSRSTAPSTSLVIDVLAAMVSAGDIKGLRKYTRVNGTMTAYQSGGMEAFAAGIRDSSSIDSSDYVDGASITHGNPRQHLFTLAVGLSYDQDLFISGMCPCGTSTRTAYCGGGTAAPAWLPLSEMACDSGTLGSPASGWRPRQMVITFDAILSETTDSVEVRLMADQSTGNEDIGIADLQIDVHESQDLLPPILTLLGSANMQLSVGEVYVEPGATCTDNIDGALVPVISGTVDTTVAGMGTHTLAYTCEDTRQNVAVAERTVTVLDNIVPEVTVTGDSQQCVVRGRVYVEYGASCLDNVDGTFAANITGNVDMNVLGSYAMTYTCTDSDGNTAVATRSVLVITDSLPGKIIIEQFQLQTSRSGHLTVAGAKSTISNVSPHSDIRLYWSKNITLSTEGCRFLSIQERTTGGWQTVRQYESTFLGGLQSINTGSPQLLTIAQGSNASLSAGLRELSQYRIVADEHLLREKLANTLNTLRTSQENTSGNTSQEAEPQEAYLAGDGTLRQHLLFTTGDYSGPAIVNSEPGANALAWPISRPVVLNFNEAVQAGLDTAFLTMLNTQSGEFQSLACNGSEGLRVTVSGKRVIIAMEAWLGWQACSDYRVDIDEGCFTDISLNLNPSISFLGYRFVTSCVVGLSPERASLQVPVASTVVLTFADAVQAGTGELYFEVFGEEVLALNASSFPVVYINNATVTVDLACKTTPCALNALSYPEAFTGLNTSEGLCCGRDLSRCRGNSLRFRIGSGAFRRLDGLWPDGCLLNGTDMLPAQLEEEDEYMFVLHPFDFTPPKFESVYAAAMGETIIRATVRIDEGGMIYCAALGGTDGDDCSAVTLLREDSDSRCGNATDPDCDGCEWPSYGCFNKTAIWIDDGCEGNFMVDGEELECGSRLSDLSVYDGGGRSILSTGWRHACAIRKVEQAVSCWGSADAGSPPAGTFLSVSSGYMHSCGVTKDTQQVVCWGNNNYGESSPPTTPDVTYKAVSCGHEFSCALRADNGEAVCWGQNDKHQASPPPGVSFWAISAGHLHVCGIMAKPNLLDSRVICWGSNLEGQSSPPDVPFMSTTPESNVLYEATISAGDYHTCGIRADTSEVLCWGSDTYGQSTVPSLTGIPIIEVAAGYTHTCVLHKALPGVSEVDGTMQCWGRNHYQQATPPAGQKFVAVDAGSDYTCGLTLDEILLCWGINFQQQTQPPTGHFGVLDSYSNATCIVDTSPTRERIFGPHKAFDAGASSNAAYSAALGYAEVELPLQGLRQSTTYQVYCYAEDDELPLPNVVTNQQMVSTHHIVTTLDRAPPSMQVLQVYSSTDDTVTVIVRLDEPGVVYCTTVRDNEPPPTLREIPALGSHAATGADLLASILIKNLAGDTEYDIYCTSHDNASSNLDAKRLDNWATYEAVLNTKRDVHTLYDTTPPTVTGFVPSSGAYATCRPSSSPGCATTVSLSFSEDVQRGEGNITFVCQTNLGVCTDVVIPMESPAFSSGTTFIENTRLDIIFDDPLVDLSTYKVVVSSGAVQDMRGNLFAMDVECPAWFDPNWQTYLGSCTPVYTFQTPT